MPVDVEAAVIENRRLSADYNVLALAAGAEVFRVHDVAQLREALDAAAAVLGRRERHAAASA